MELQPQCRHSWFLTLNKPTSGMNSRPAGNLLMIFSVPQMRKYGPRSSADGKGRNSIDINGATPVYTTWLSGQKCFLSQHKIKSAMRHSPWLTPHIGGVLRGSVQTMAIQGSNTGTLQYWDCRCAAAGACRSEEGGCICPQTAVVEAGNGRLSWNHRSEVGVEFCISLSEICRLANTVYVNQDNNTTKSHALA